MPELPEVETIVRTCRPRLVGRRIVDFSSSWPKGVLPSRPKVKRALAGRPIQRLTRRGKFVVFHLTGNNWLLVHFRMSGRFEWAAAGAPARHVRATWDLDDGNRLLFCDARKFGRIIYTRDLAAATKNLGPEPLSRAFTPDRLAGLLRTRKRQLKPLLLDQSVIAGLGNIYADEALFRAGLHPTMCSDRLTDEQVLELHEAIRYILRMAIRCHGTSFDWAYPDGWMQKRLMAYGRTGQPCRLCDTPIIALRVAQRGTHICPNCQRPRRTSPARARR